MSDQQTTSQAMPSDMASRMQAIIRKHAEAYCRDLPGLIEEMRQSLEHVLAHPADEEALATLQRQAHDMKGQGATFGLTGISAVVGSFSRLLENKASLAPALQPVLHRHVAALKQLLEQDDAELVAATVIPIASP